MDQELQVEPCWTTGNFVLGQETFEGGGGKVGKFSLVGLQNLTKCRRVTCWWTLGSHLSHTGLVALQVICVMIKVWRAATCSVCNFPYAQNFFFFGRLIRACGRQPWITLCFNCYADFILIICQCLWFDPNIKQINSWVIDVILETGQCLVTFASPHAITNKEASLRSLFTKQGQSKFIPLNCLNPRVFSMQFLLSVILLNHSLRSWE